MIENFQPKSLVEALELLDIFFNVNPSGVFIYSKEGHLIECNEMACKMHGIPKHKMLSMTPKDFIHPDGYPTFLAFQEDLQTKGSFHGESAGLTADGRKFDVEVFGKMIVVNGTEYLYGIIRDISEAKNHQRLIESANNMKSQFLASVSHELRTPLTAIIGFSELLLHQVKDERKKELYIESIHRNANHLHELLTNVIDLSLIEAGKIVVDPQSFKLRAMLTEVLQNCEDTNKGTDMPINLTVARDVPDQITTDSGKLRQILTNLVTNAYKYARSGALIIDVRRNSEGSQLIITVEDQGPGIDFEDRFLVFEYYFRSDKQRSLQTTGAGLGLPLSRQLARALGGDLRLVDPEPGNGAKFELTLPLIAITSPVGHGSAPLDSKRFKDLKILIAEDNPDSREVFKGIFAQLSVHCVFAADGAEAVKTFRDAGPFDAVLLDLDMPVLSGFEAAAAIRLLSPNVPLIAVTAHALEEVRQRCLNQGFSDFVTKPVTASALVSALLPVVRPNL